MRTESVVSALAMAVVTVLASTVVAQRGPAAPRMNAFFDQVRKGDDIGWLEQIASSAEFLHREWADRVGDVAVGKELRVDAYVRLGAIATSESLAAISRVNTRLRDGRTLPDSSDSGWYWESPATWMGGQHLTPAGDVLVGRRHYAVMLLAAYSPAAPYLSWRDEGDRRWTRPRLAGDPVPSASLFDAHLEARPQGLFVVFSRRPLPAGAVAPSAAVPAPLAINIDDVERDADHDGWSDLEERTLGMSPARADSDGDGISDDRDATPAYAAPPSEDQDEEAQVLRRAFFAVYGLTGSPFAIYVRSNLRAVQLYGLSGPVFFGLDLPPRVGCGGRGGNPCVPTRGAEVAWRFLDRSVSQAAIEFTTWQGSSFWSKSLTRLRKIGSEWIVVECRLAGIT